MKAVTYGLQLVLLLVVADCSKTKKYDNEDEMVCRNPDLRYDQQNLDPQECLTETDDGSFIIPHRREEQTCPEGKSGMENYHVVPWIVLPTGVEKNISTLYNGDDYHLDGIKHIMDHVIDKLTNNENQRFILTQTSFFWMWWSQQHDAMRHVVHSLVENGQLEFAGGGWVENDEAITYYQATIDQMTVGLRRLHDIFGMRGRPYASWQMGAFGHSRTQAHIFSLMDFDGVFVDRIDNEERDKRIVEQSLQLIWEASNKNIGGTSNIFTYTTDFEVWQMYEMMGGLDIEVLAINNTVDGDGFKEYIATIGDFYEKTENKFLHIGYELGYSSNSHTFLNLDWLMEYVNSQEATKGRKEMNIFYSSPACFLKALNSEAKTFPTKNDDFLPYSSPDKSYWSGFFTSKPNIKYFERLGNNFLQVSKQLYSMTDVGPPDWPDLNRLREAVATMQQIGAITGTANDAVGQDYVRILNEAMVKMESGADGAIKVLLTKESDPIATPIKLESCLLLNISMCEVTESQADFVVTVYNPLGYRRSHYVRVPVNGKSYSVVDPNGVGQEKQFVPIPTAVLTLTGRTNTTYDLVFMARDLPPLGFKSYYIQLSESEDEFQTGTSDSTIQEQEEGEDQNLEARDTTVKLDDKGALKSLSMNTITLNLTHSFAYYKSKPSPDYVDEFGNTRLPTPKEFLEKESLAASIFAPGTDEATVVPLKSTEVYRGDIVDEVHQVFEGDYITQVIRIYQEYNQVEFEWMVGPIAHDSTMNTDVVSRFETELGTQGKFYTDSNGREMLERNRRPSTTGKRRSPATEPISSNYYPVATRIVIKDEALGYEAAVVTDRGQGGSSLKDGHIELMVHRRTVDTDTPPVSATVDHKLVSRGKHVLIAGKQKGLKPCLHVQERQIVLQTLLKPWVFVSKTADEMCFDDWKATFRMEFSGLQRALPPNVHILTLEPWKKRSLLLRLEHFVDNCFSSTGEVEDQAKPAVVDLKTLFSTFKIVSYRETTLDGNVWLTDSMSLKWQKKIDEEDTENETPNLESTENNEDSATSDITIVTKAPVTTTTLEEDTDFVPRITDNKRVKFQGSRHAKLSFYPPSSVGRKKPKVKRILLKPMQIRTFVIEISEMVHDPDECGN